MRCVLLAVWGLAVLILVACSPRIEAALPAKAEAGRLNHLSEGYPTGIELPDGEGVELVRTACTRCHDLAGLEAYQGYWNERRWRSMVETMVRNGAELNGDEVELVTEYLTRFYGPGTRDGAAPK